MHVAYADLFATEVTIGVSRWAVSMTLRDWISDGAMTLFFFVVGLEVKREFVSGELRNVRAAAVPLIGAAGGMLVPALIYTAINVGHEGSRGWGMPVATDIAFAVGVLAVLGRRAPAGLKLLLLTLAVADDVGGIIVIAVAYVEDVHLAYVPLAAIALLGAALAGRLGVPWLVIVLAIAAWLTTRASGIHPTVAGVVLALLTPVRPIRQASGSQRSPTDALQRLLHPYTSLLIAPLFALANVGIRFDGVALDAPGATRVALGAGVGLLVGKLVGVTGAVWLAVRVGIGQLPSDVTMRHVVGGGLVAGIGFTVSLFIGAIAFEDDSLRRAASASVLMSSVVAAILGCAWLSYVARAETTGDGGDELPWVR